MIQDLPLLPSDWALWNWTTGNGTASAEQTQKAYRALVEKGECADFSRLVWNDLVDTLATALLAAGIDWDTKYCSADECKIDVTYGALSANAFNSVRYNIDRFDIVHWSWSYIQKDGYLGRTEVRGYEKYGSWADLVYGYYITELAEHLNLLLRVLSDTADFGNMEYLSYQQFIQDIHLHDAKSALVFLEKKYKTYQDMNLAKCGVQPIESAISSCTSFLSDMMQIQTVSAAFSQRFFSFLDTDMQWIGTRSFGHTMKTKTAQLSEIEWIRCRGLKHTFMSDSYVEAEINNLYLAYPRILEVSQIDTDIQMDTMCGKDFGLEFYATGRCFEKLVCVGPKFFITSASAQSVMNFVLEFSDPRSMNGPIICTSESYIDMAYAEPYQMAVSERLSSGVQTKISWMDTKYLSLVCKSEIAGWIVAFRKSTKQLQMVAMVAFRMRCDIGSVKSCHEEVLSIGDTYVLINIDATVPTEVQVRRCIGCLAEAEAVMLELKKIDTLFVNKSKVFTEIMWMQPKVADVAALVSACILDVGVLPVESVYEQCVHQSSSSLVSMGVSIESTQMSSETKTESRIEGTLSCGRTIEIPIKEKCISDVDIQLHKCKAADLEVSVTIQSNCLGSAETDGTGVDWYDPIEDGRGVYIRSAHPQWEEGDMVHLDSGGVFYEPVEEERGVYIRSTDSLKGV